MTNIRTPNWKKLDMTNKCGGCRHYKMRPKGNLETASGNCLLNGIYKMRTESCRKYESKEEC